MRAGAATAALFEGNGALSIMLKRAQAKKTMLLCCQGKHLWYSQVKLCPQFLPVLNHRDLLNLARLVPVYTKIPYENLVSLRASISKTHGAMYEKWLSFYLPQHGAVRRHRRRFHRIETRLIS
jgi:hypothetical protein